MPRGRKAGSKNKTVREEPSFGPRFATAASAEAFLGRLSHVVCQWTGVDHDDLVGTCRARRFSTARALFWAGARRAEMSYPFIARYSGHNHSTVLCAVRKRDAFCGHDIVYRQTWQAVVRLIEQTFAIDASDGCTRAIALKRAALWAQGIPAHRGTVGKTHVFNNGSHEVHEWPSRGLSPQPFTVPHPSVVCTCGKCLAFEDQLINEFAPSLLRKSA